jgi:PAS domain S-box-containing protein
MVSPLHDANGRLVAYDGLLLDITQQKQAAVERAEFERLRRLVEHLPAGAVYRDRNDLRVNRRTEEITGYSRKELATLDDWLAKLCGDNAESMRQFFAGDDRRDFAPTATVLLRRKDGATRFVEFAAYRIDHQEVWLLYDVTKRINMEASLRASEERFDLAIRGSADGIWDWPNLDQDGEWWSPRFFELLGYEPAEIEPRFSTFKEMLHPDDRPLVRAAARSHLQDDIRYDIEYRLKTKSGHYRWFRARADVLRDEQGRAIRMTGCLEDIDHRKQVEEALRSEHELTERIIDTAQQIILVLDAQARILRVNRFFDELRGRDWFETFLPERDRDRVRQLFLRATVGQRTRGNMNVIVTRDGRERMIQWHDAPLTASDGTMIGLLCTGEDVTEQRAMERHVLDASNEEQRRIGQDLHDGVGQELTGLGMMADALLTALRSRSAPETEVAEKLVRGLKRNVGNVRALSRGLNPVDVGPHGLQAALHELTRRASELYGLPCSFHAESEVDVASSDIATQLYRIAQEAINNAAKHSQATEVKISLSRDDGNIHLRVLDDGLGIPPGVQAGIGMRSMGYRAGVIGGELRIEHRDEGGTIVQCVIPTAQDGGQNPGDGNRNKLKALSQRDDRGNH